MLAPCPLCAAIFSATVGLVFVPVAGSPADFGCCWLPGAPLRKVEGDEVSGGRLVVAAVAPDGEPNRLAEVANGEAAGCEASTRFGTAIGLFFTSFEATGDATDFGRADEDSSSAAYFGSSGAAATVGGALAPLTIPFAAMSDRQSSSGLVFAAEAGDDEGCCDCRCGCGCN